MKKVPGRKDGHPRTGSTAGELEDRLDDLAELMTLYGDHAAARRMRRRCIQKTEDGTPIPGSEPALRTVLGWCQRVRQRWAEDATLTRTDPIAAHAEAKARVSRIHSRAMTRKKGGELDPNLKEGLNAARTLAQLDGLLTSVPRSAGEDAGARQGQDIIDAVAQVQAAAARHGGLDQIVTASTQQLDEALAAETIARLGGADAVLAALLRAKGTGILRDIPDPEKP